MAIAAKISRRRYKGQVTVTAGTPIFICPTPLKAASLLIQMIHGGSGYGLVYNDVPPGTAAGQVAAADPYPEELAAASATSPGGAYQDAGSIELNTIALDGSNTGDIIRFDARLVI